MEKKGEKIKVYADKLDRELKIRKWAILSNILIYVFLVGALIFLSMKGNVIVVGENLVAKGEAGFVSDSPEVMRIKADGHARLFYERFFTFDYNNFEGQKNRAIYLGGGAIEKVYSLLKRAGFYEEIIDNHYVVTSYLDSTQISFTSSNKTLINVRCYGRMSMTNNVYLEVRALDLDLSLTPITPIKELNPFGLSINKMDLISNEVIKTSKYMIGGD